MKVTITKDQLLAVGAGPIYLGYPDEAQGDEEREDEAPPVAPLMHGDWDEEQEALVYEDWNGAVARLSSTKDGLALLAWLVSRALVPMTLMRLHKLRRAAKKG